MQRGEQRIPYNRLNVSIFRGTPYEVRRSILQTGVIKDIPIELVNKAIRLVERGKFEKCTIRYPKHGVEINIFAPPKPIRHHSCARFIKWVRGCYLKACLWVFKSLYNAFGAIQFRYLGWHKKADSKVYPK